MAGNYPDPPSYRMPYHRDGTQGFILNGNATGVVSTLSESQLRALNAENGGGVQPAPNEFVCLIFPELRDLDAYAVWVVNYYQAYNALQVSSDTTNGIDGTWTSLAKAANAGSTTGLRTAILSSTALSIRAVRMQFPGDYTDPGALHLYGEPVPSAAQDRLELWHPTLDQKISHTYFEYGDVARLTTTTKPFRIKNLSATQRAVSVRAAMEALYDANPSVPGWHALSLDGASWLAQVNVGNLEPGAISPVIQHRQSIPANAVLSLWTAWLFAEAASWEVA